MAPQNLEIWDQDDDWTEMISPKERRRRQNRLHQRAYRAKKRLEKFPHTHAISEQGSRAVVLSAACPIREDWGHLHGSRQHQAQLIMAMLDQLPVLLLVRCTNIHDKMREFLQTALTNWGLNLPITRDLPFVTRLNTFDALARNALMLRIPLEYLETDEHSSLFNCQGPPRPPDELPGVPTQLRPTALQRTVRHHSWLDLFPIPGMRDNMLRGIEAGLHDEDQLCEAICCDLLNFDHGTNAPLVVWGESWDANGWEFSPEFFAAWGVLLQGCTEVLENTNYWREKRGEPRLTYNMGH